MPPKKSLKLQVYNIIKNKIIDCEYAPNMVLNEEMLRDELNVSRTPIRDALSRLEQDGLISIMPKKGIKVSDLTINDINMIFEVRMLYEPYALLHYGPEIYKALIRNEELIDFLHESSASSDKFTQRTFFDMDDLFHASIISAIPNRYMRQTYRHISDQNRRFRVLTGQVDTSRLERTSTEHLSIVTACLKQEWEQAAKEMEVHLNASKNVTFDLLFNSKKLTL